MKSRFTSKDAEMDETEEVIGPVLTAWQSVAS